MISATSRAQRLREGVTPTIARHVRRVRALALPGLLAAALALAMQPALAEDIAGRVVGITDGDTLTVLTEQREQVRVRLADIDTPERGQPWGNRAREHLSALVFDQQVHVEVRDTDRYGRTVGRVRAGSVDVNAEMVRDGSAWVYRRYARNPGLLKLEEEARTARRGLWSLPEAERTPPWEWRAAERKSRAPS